MKIGIYIFSALMLSMMMSVDARLYRWTDGQGNVHYSDKMPDSSAKGLTELDQRGMVRKTPEKKISAEDIARQEVEQKALLEQKRRDKALLDSFSNTAEIDALHDRQISAVQVRQQNIQLRMQETGEKHRRLTAQISVLTQKRKKVPEVLAEDAATTQKELDRLEAETRKSADEIDAIKERTEQDKKRYTELRGTH